jgi:hypothetical protein
VETGDRYLDRYTVFRVVEKFLRRSLEVLNEVFDVRYQDAQMWRFAPFQPPQHRCQLVVVGGLSGAIPELTNPMDVSSSKPVTFNQRSSGYKPIDY